MNQVTYPNVLPVNDYHVAEAERPDAPSLMFNSGGCYPTFPTWISFNRQLAQLAGILIEKCMKFARALGSIYIALYE